MFQFQKGVLISSKSLPKLHEMLREKYGVTYIRIYKLNQDLLEIFFASVRQMLGCCDHPSPVGMKNCVKKILLGRDIALVGSKYNTQTQESAKNLSECQFTCSAD